jgi:hypothetical protein
MNGIQCLANLETRALLKPTTTMKKYTANISAETRSAKRLMKDI